MSEESARSECFDAFFDGSRSFVRINDVDYGKERLEEVFAATVGHLYQRDPRAWNDNITMRVYLLRHSRMIGVVAGRLARAAGRSYLVGNDIEVAADEIIRRAREICNVPEQGPGCEGYKYFRE